MMNGEMQGNNYVPPNYVPPNYVPPKPVIEKYSIEKKDLHIMYLYPFLSSRHRAKTKVWDISFGD